MPTMSNEHVTSKQSDLAQDCNDVAMTESCNECSRSFNDDPTCEFIENKSNNFQRHGHIESADLKTSRTHSHSKAMSSCAAHPPKNGNDDQNDLSLSSSSSSSSRNSASMDSEKKSKMLKSLLKKKIDPNQDFIKSHNKRVKFSETMQVFCYELPDNQMPQIIALKSPAELNLMEFQSYMFEPPAEYQDFLTFEPPPDYRDFIANSLSVFRNEVTFDYIDDDDDDSESANGPTLAKQSKEKKGNHINSLVITNDSGHNSKWQSMILDNNLDSLEEEQIIGVLKEDDILQAIGSQITLPVSSDPRGLVNGDRAIDEQIDSKAYAFEVLDAHEHFEENLSSEDFPVHHLNSYLLNSSGNIDEEDEDACCIDSSPNGSLQDLASDSSITSQDTIILINQNKTFHLDSINNTTIGVNQGNNPSTGDNIYENVQHCGNGELSLLGGKVHFEHMKRENSPESNQNKRDITLPPDKPEEDCNQKNGQMCEVLYENTSELLANVCVTGPSMANHMSNTAENRLSTSSSDDSKMEGGEHGQSNQVNTNKFKQNLMFYENMLQNNVQPNSSSPLSINSKHVPTENGRVVGPNVQRGKVAVGVANAETSHLAIPVRFPLYTIVDANRTSSSSSLSSTSSSSSSLVTSTNNTQLQPTLTSIASNLSSSNLVQQPGQVSPNSISSASSSSSAMLHEYLQYAPKARAPVPGKLNETNPTGNCINVLNNNAPHFAVPSSLNEPHMSASYGNATPLQHSQRPPGPQTPICVANNGGHIPNQIRAGQVVYRLPGYPCAFLQQTTPNGVSTLRPVQYFVQTNSQTGAQSFLCNPGFVINNQPAAYTISSATTTGNVSSSGPVINNSNMVTSNNTATAIGQQQTMPGHTVDSSIPIPIRRIIVPQGTVLGPRIMHLHHQHKQAPPPYQYYMQQKQQQQAIFAYQQNVQFRAGTPGQVQSMDVNHQSQHGHTEFPNPSEIRRRDGLYAYPQVLLKTEDGKVSSQGAKGNENSDSNLEEKDELEEFVQQEQQRTDRIRKRYSFTEDDDPTFGFARRPSVRGIRPKFGTTNEIIQQMTSTIPKQIQQQKVIMTNSNMSSQHASPVFIEKPTYATYGTIHKNAQFININPGTTSHPQMISIVKQVGDLQLSDNSQSNVPVHLKSQTLPRQLHKMASSEPVSVSAETVRIVDANLLNGPNSTINVGTMSRDQLKLQIQKQLERQIQLPQKSQASRVALNPNVHGQRPLASDERGVPEGASYSPNHPGVGAETVPFGGNGVPPKDLKANLVSENNKPNGPEMVYYSLNV